MRIQVRMPPGVQPGGKMQIEYEGVKHVINAPLGVTPGQLFPVELTATSVPADDTVEISVRVPRGATVGQSIKVQYQGQDFNVRVPQGVRPGQEMRVRVPRHHQQPAPPPAPEPVPPPSVPADDTVEISVRVPRGATVGQSIKVQYQGQDFNVRVPQGVRPGQEMRVRVPRHHQQPTPPPAPEPVPPSRPANTMQMHTPVREVPPTSPETIDISVRVPRGATVGQSIKVQYQGQDFNVRVPQGVRPGQEMTVRVPRHHQQPAPPPAPEPVPPPVRVPRHYLNLEPASQISSQRTEPRKLPKPARATPSPAKPEREREREREREPEPERERERKPHRVPQRNSRRTTAKKLLAMGYDRDMVQLALEFCSDVDEAVSMLANWHVVPAQREEKPASAPAPKPARAPPSPAEPEPEPVSQIHPKRSTARVAPAGNRHTLQRAAVGRTGAASSISSEPEFANPLFETQPVSERQDSSVGERDKHVLSECSLQDVAPLAISGFPAARTLPVYELPPAEILKVYEIPAAKPLYDLPPAARTLPLYDLPPAEILKLYEDSPPPPLYGTSGIRPETKTIELKMPRYDQSRSEIKRTRFVPPIRLSGSPLLQKIEFKPPPALHTS